ncbi:MAG: ABC transporter permease [Acidimicrobiales bacterium]
MTAALDSWRVAADALRANWFRAVLTALGVVIGVGSLVAVSAVSAGAQAGVAESIRRLGANVVIVDGEIISIGTRQSPTDRVITPADVAAIAKLPMIAAVAPHQDIEGLVVSAAATRPAPTWWV